MHKERKNQYSGVRDPPMAGHYTMCDRALHISFVRNKRELKIAL